MKLRRFRPSWPPLTGSPRCACGCREDMHDPETGECLQCKECEGFHE